MKLVECDQCKELQDVVDEQLQNMQLLQKELAELRNINTKYEILLTDNGLLEKVSTVSPEEAICIEQIRILKEKSSRQPFSETDCKILDILHKNLKIARGEKVAADGKGKTKKLTDEELTNIIKLVE
jgi:hypothetical protein